MMRIADSSDATNESHSATCHNVDFNSYIVQRNINQLSSKTSCGPDLIPPILLKKLAPQLALPLAVLSTKSFNNGFIPDILKIAHVTLVFKEATQVILQTIVLSA